MKATRVGSGRLEAFSAIGRASVRPDPSIDFSECSVSGNAILFLLSFGPRISTEKMHDARGDQTCIDSIFAISCSYVRTISSQPPAGAVHRHSPTKCVPGSGGIAV